MEQARLAFHQPIAFGGRALAAVALQLNEGFVHRVGAGRRTFLALHHRQRQAVHEQHDVGDDETAHATRCVDAELVDRVKAVALRVLKVDQLHHGVFLAGGLVHIHLRLHQQLVHRQVGLEQRAARVAQ